MDLSIQLNMVPFGFASVKLQQPWKVSESLEDTRVVQKDVFYRVPYETALPYCRIDPVLPHVFYIEPRTTA